MACFSRNRKGQELDTIHSDEDLNSALGGHSAGSGFTKHFPGTYCHTYNYVRSDTEWHMALYSIYGSNNVIEYQYHATISDGCLQRI
jgi:hypothetical protein